VAAYHDRTSLLARLLPLPALPICIFHRLDNCLSLLDVIMIPWLEPIAMHEVVRATVGLMDRITGLGSGLLRVSAFALAFAIVLGHYSDDVKSAQRIRGPWNSEFWVI